MKLLLDQGLPRSAVASLSAAGVEAVHASDVGLSTAEDVLLLERGRAEDRIVVTLDADFHTLMALPGATKPSVIRIRIEGLRGEALAALVVRVLQQCSDDLEQGALVSVVESGVRIRRLPIT